MSYISFTPFIDFDDVIKYTPLVGTISEFGRAITTILPKTYGMSLIQRTYMEFRIPSQSLKSLQNIAMTTLTQQQITFLFGCKDQYPDIIKLLDKDREYKYRIVLRNIRQLRSQTSWDNRYIYHYKRISLATQEANIRYRSFKRRCKIRRKRTTDNESNESNDEAWYLDLFD